MEHADSPELLLMGKGFPRSKEDLISLLPEKAVVDRLVMAYFTAMSPSQRTKLRSPSQDGGDQQH